MIPTLPIDELTTISPLDGRYRSIGERLATWASEFGLIQNRVLVEIEWLIFLSEHRVLPEYNRISPNHIESLREIHRSFSLDDARRVKTIEKNIRHDVKAVEVFLREKFQLLGFESYVEVIHFGCTSEDINNIAYGRMVQEIVQSHLLRSLDQLVNCLLNLAEPHLQTPMLARTHGQPASPTTMGKELLVFAARIHGIGSDLATKPVFGKMNGAVGNYNAHHFVLPGINWIQLGTDFVASLQLRPNAITTQIEPHDSFVDIFDQVSRANLVLLDCVRDLWGYISLGYFTQKKTAGEVGSSTMPHKVNPIDFENSEGNLGISNALLRHLSDKLPVSRWQRDLSDSTVLRNVGMAFGYALLGYTNAIQGFGKLEINGDRLMKDLQGSWEVLTEAVQTTMRLEGVENSYEKIKLLTRGQQLDHASYQLLVKNLDLSQASRDKLLQLNPETYLGLAPEIGRATITAIRSQPIV